MINRGEMVETKKTDIFLQQKQQGLKFVNFLFNRIVHELFQLQSIFT